MTPKQALKELEALGNEKTRKHNTKYGAPDNQFGCNKGDIRKLAKNIKANHELGLELWKTGNIDAQFLAILLIKPKNLSSEELDEMVRDLSFVHVADWFNSYLVNKHPNKEELRQIWMKEKHPMAARSGWSLTAARIAKDAEGIDLSGILDRIEKEMGKAAPETQWTMNFALVEIGIHCKKLRKRAIAIGEKLGMYRDFPVPKGCTSPFAPIWIGEMVKRQG